MRKTVITAVLLAGMALTAQLSGTFSGMLRERLIYCMQTLIPSIFGCMLLADILCRSGCMNAGRILRRIAQILHLPASVSGIFAVSQIAGYPVGAALLKQECERGSLSAESARRFTAVCFGGGPAFLVGLAGAQLFGSAAAGWMMLAAAVMSNFLLLVILPKPPVSVQCADRAQKISLNAGILTESVAHTVHALLNICGAVMLFGILLTAADVLHLFDLLSRMLHIPVQTLRPVLAAAADITQLPAVFRIGLPYRVLLPLCAGLLSFGGCCAQIQACALGVPGMQFARLTAVRLLAGLLTALLTALLVPLISLPETVPVFAPAFAVSKSGSLLPGVMILCTGLIAAARDS